MRGKRGVEGLLSENTMLDVRRMVIEKIKIANRISIPRHIIERMEVSQYIDEMTDNIVWNIESFIAGNKTERINHKFIHVPLTWFEHLKQEHFPQWALKRWPVKMKEIATQTTNYITNVCPHINLPQRDKSHYEFVCYEGLGGGERFMKP